MLISTDLQVAEKSDVIFIAVKPQYVGLVLKEMKGQIKKETIIVSIAAGVPLAAMKVHTLLWIASYTLLSSFHVFSIVWKI